MLERFKTPLKTYFGHENFRSGQEEIITALCQREDVLGILPTGGGKSLCYQMAGIMLGGVTLVISPLISLMKDQTQALRAKNLAAANLDSGMSGPEQTEILRQAAEKKLQFLYVSPERLQSTSFLEAAAHMDIRLLAIDEAHCVSQWGKAFRPEYYQIKDFVQTLNPRPVLGAFTATATPEVRQDIIKHLQLQHPKIFVQGFDRPNLTFTITKTGNKDLSILSFLEKHPGETGIIYCATRRQVSELNQLLQRYGYSSRRYHGGLTPLERQLNQEAFIQGHCPIIVATNAFGMGIDKANVRYVLHYCCPKDLESYYQEAGRAGRDGHNAQCILFYNPEDLDTNLALIANSQLSREQKKHDEQLLSVMEEFCHLKKDWRAFILHYFGEE